MNLAVTSSNSLWVLILNSNNFEFLLVHFFSFFCDKKRKETEPSHYCKSKLKIGKLKHSVSPFCTKNKFSAKEGKKRKKNATVGQGFTLKPEICLMRLLIKQKPSLRGFKPELALGREKSVFSFWLLFLFSSI